ncbi:MAG: hypothetical protein U0T75_05655 [Chitinophagales bacterium]
MKKLAAVTLIFTLLTIAFSSCKKCFTCHNTCVQCSITVGSNNFSHTLCRDSFNTEAEYNAAIATDTAAGYTCGSTAPTYSYDYCVNQPGEESYQNYFNKGKKVTCDEK